MSEVVRFQHFEVLRREDGSLEELGRGAMGITYKAFDTNLRCAVALKVINSAYLNSEVARQRFLREARAAAALRHPNVATVFHLGNEDDSYFYAMEFVDGETVEAMMKRDGAVPPKLALEIVLQVARALGAAQKQGLVHRDIKPSNLMLVRDDQDLTVKVIDFGLAKNAANEGGEDTATLTMGGFLGTPHFASPEQLEERIIDIRSDIYSLGVTLWYMLAGRTPFSGSLAQVMSQHLHRDPPFEHLETAPPCIVRLLRHMMAKDPAARPQSPADLRREIEACLAELTQSIPAPPPIPPPEPETFDTAVLPEPLVPSAVDLASGVVLAGRFRLVNEMTASDFGRMFRAESTEDGSQATVLILNASLLPTSESFTRLEEQVAALSAIPSPAITRILSLERGQHESFLVLEAVEGPTLLDLLRARKALPVGEALEISRPVAEAFDALGCAGLACPDLSPHEIVFVGGSPQHPVTAWPQCVPKFLALTFSEPTLVSPDATMVASPYALLRESGAFGTSPASAFVFALASLLYEMLGGVRVGTTTGSYVPIPGLSEGGNAALRRALNPTQSFESCTELLAAISTESAGWTTPAPAPAAPASAPASAPPPLPARPAPSPPKRSPVPLIAGGIAALLVFGILGVAGVWWSGGMNRPKIASDSPTPSPSPEAVPVAQTATPEPTPTPSATPNDSEFQNLMATAEMIERQGNPTGALAAYVKTASVFPDKSGPIEAINRVCAALQEKLATTAPSELAPLRGSLEQAAARNIPSAQILLGEILRDSEPAEAMKWFLTASDAGQTDAMVLVGQMMASGRGVAAPDAVGAVAWFRRAADAGDPAGMYFLGECALFGKGVTRDPKLAIDLLSAAAERGNPRAMNLLGDLHKKGVPGLLEPNPAEAFRLFSAAKEKGFLDAQGNLGVLYINGVGTEKNEAQAVDLFRDGAQKGNALCMYFFAMSLENGIAGASDEKAATAWYIQAAEAGNKPAAEWCRQRDIPFQAPQ